MAETFSKLMEKSIHGRYVMPQTVWANNAIQSKTSTIQALLLGIIKTNSTKQHSTHYNFSLQ